MNRTLFLRKNNYIKFWQRWSSKFLSSLENILVIFDIATAAEWVDDSRFIKDVDLLIECSQTHPGQKLVIRRYRQLLEGLNIGNSRYPNLRLALTDTLGLRPTNSAQIISTISQLAQPILIILGQNTFQDSPQSQNDSCLPVDGLSLQRVELLKEIRQLENLSKFTLIVFASREILKVKLSACSIMQNYHGIKSNLGTLIHLNLDDFGSFDAFTPRTDSLTQNCMFNTTAESSALSSDNNNIQGTDFLLSDNYELRNSHIALNNQTLSFDLIHLPSHQKFFHFSLSVKDFLSFVVLNYPKSMSALKKSKLSNLSRNDILTHLLTQSAEAKSFFQTEMLNYAKSNKISQTLPPINRIIVSFDWIRKLSFLIGGKNRTKLDTYDSLGNSTGAGDGVSSSQMSTISGAFSNHIKI